MVLHWAGLCAAGACVHVGVQGVLWGLAARPPGPERRLLGLLRGRLRRRSVMT
jgi:hypothetical protein